MSENITHRQSKILTYLAEASKSRSEIEELLSKDYSASKVTVIRDLAELMDKGIISQQGSGPSTYYALADKPNNLPIYNLDEYFKIDVDKRNIKGIRFQMDLIKKIEQLFNPKELFDIEASRKDFENVIKRREATDIKKELERFVIELSWKSSKIEGNTYTLLDTENLIKNNIASPNNTKEESQMIINHKNAFNYILKNLVIFKDFSEDNLKKIHTLLVKDLNINTDYRTHSVGITGTKYLPLDNKYQIEDAIKELKLNLKNVKSAFVKAFITLVFISYIQPFADGNKRTARMLSNAILISNNYYPLSYRNIDEIEYKKALIIFYEQFNIYYFKDIFLNQYKFSTKNYFA